MLPHGVEKDGLADTDANEGIPPKLSILAQYWLRQSCLVSCLPTCLYNIFTEVASRKNAYKPFNPSLDKIKRLSGFTPMGGAPWDEARKGLQTEMRKEKIKEWALLEAEGKKNSYDLLCQILGSKHCSYPVVTLGGEYLMEEYDVVQTGSPHCWMSHSVIVVKATPDSCLLFDPLSLDGENNFRWVSRVSFEMYWSCGSPERGVLWLRSSAFPLESFDGAGVNE